jgi:putative transcriptional regulator
MIHCRLNLLMAERRLNVSELSRATGISRTMLSNLYNDDFARIDVETLDKLCNFFACDVGDLLTQKKAG